MYIANPLYDVVFKYMMEDIDVAKKFISAIIGENVVELDFTPTEYVLKIDIENQVYTVFHLDFSAKIKTKEGFQSVIIEIQKTKLPIDIMRFRRYLGGQYQSKSNYYTDSKGKLKARQIYCIFILGAGLGMKGIPVLEIDQKIKDLTTQKEFINLKNEFIEGLHHRSWIIQVPELPNFRRNDVEKMLAIFDQTYCVSEDKHLLIVPDNNIPEEYKKILKRLNKAFQNEEVKDQMTVEDLWVENFKINERINEALKKELSENLKVLSEKDKTISEKEVAHQKALARIAELEQSK